MKKRELIGIVFILILILILSSMYNSNRKLKIDNKRVSSNLLSSKFRIDSLTDINGKAFYQVSALELKSKELDLFNSELTEEIDKLNIKIENLESVSNIKYVYITKIDTIKVNVVNDSTLTSSYKDEWLSLSQQINIRRDNYSISNIALELKDELLLPFEVEYKGFWFWKKAINFKLTIKSTNPYFKLNKVETFKLIK